MNKQQSQLPLGKILAGIGISTLLLSIGLFFFITSGRSWSKTNSVAAEVSSEGNSGTTFPPPRGSRVSDDEKKATEPRNISPVNQDPVAVEPTVVAEPPPEQSTLVTPPNPTESSQALSGATGVAPGAHDEWEKLLGFSGTLEGIVEQSSKSGSGKTLYLYFSQNRKDTMVFMLVREVDAVLTPEFLSNLEGKRVRVTGKVENQFGTGRVGVRIKHSSQIEVVE